MLKRLSFEKLAIDKEHISILDVYCSKRAKRVLERGAEKTADIFGQSDPFDGLTQIVIGPLGQTNPILLPCSFGDFQLLERNEFYGINGDYLPSQVLASTFKVVYMDAEIKLPGPRHSDEGQLPKIFFLKSVQYKDQVGHEFQLEFGPDVALDLTQRLRDYLPAGVLKGVTSYLEIPSLATG